MIINKYIYQHKQEMATSNLHKQIDTDKHPKVLMNIDMTTIIFF